MVLENILCKKIWLLRKTVAIMLRVSGIVTLQLPKTLGIFRRPHVLLSHPRNH